MTHGAAYSATGTAAPALKYQLGWDEADWEILTTILSSCSVAGGALGFLAGGTLIQKGRKKMIIIFNVFIIIGSVMSMFLDTTVMCVGRFVFGFATGILATATPKIIEETIPDYVIDKGYGVSTNCSICFGIFVCFLLGIAMPQDSEELKTTHMWRIVYLFPVLNSILAIIGSTCV